MNTGIGPGWVRTFFVGPARHLSDSNLFHRLSLVAVLAWVGLGADGLSSSCYGPEESFKALGAHAALSPFVALACVLTIGVICASYAQIIEVFPGGGGGYLVASKLLSPAAGVVSGCALLVDYVLTIAVSIASGADAVFSLLPPAWLGWKLPFALAGVGALTLLNLRGVKESVLLGAPVFFVFLATHAFAILFAIGTHLAAVPEVVTTTAAEVGAVQAQLGWAGLLLLLTRAYSMGAGTYTGIEAVSNGLPILREPRVATGQRTMVYIGGSLALTVGGLMLAYLLYRVEPVPGQTLNAVLFGRLTSAWPAWLARAFLSLAMLSAAAILFIGAQAGFLDGPRVLASLARDRWMPGQFAALSDRFVTQNGVLLMGGVALAVLLAARGLVTVLVVLNSISVFITFSLSQLGMLRHWWTHRAAAARWRGKIAVNALGFTLTSLILAGLCVVKFFEGGWVTLVVTGLLVGTAFLIKGHYARTYALLRHLDDLVHLSQISARDPAPPPAALPCAPAARTAVLLVNGFNGLGLHALLAVQRLFPKVYENFVFLEVGAVDAGNFKGALELENLRRHVAGEAERYAEYVRRRGFRAETRTGLGHDVVETAVRLAEEVAQRFPQAVFFGGQLVFERETRLTRCLHNHVVFALQRHLFRRGYPFLILPIRVGGR